MMNWEQCFLAETKAVYSPHNEIQNLLRNVLHSVEQIIKTNIGTIDLTIGLVSGTTFLSGNKS